MASHTKVLNITTGKRHKRSQAKGWVEQCCCAWVDQFTIRNLTPAEKFAARREQVRLNDPLPFAEIPGLKFDHPGAYQECWLGVQANKFELGTHDEDCQCVRCKKAKAA